VKSLLCHASGPPFRWFGTNDAQPGNDEATAILNRYKLPTQWHVYPPPALGGLIRTYNIFEAFIDLEMDQEARPGLMQICDNIDKAIWRCEKEMHD
jgi:hypothetical protein